MSLPDLESWAIFVAVADQGSFASAARELGISIATASRAVARLEARLGATLLHRTSRRLALSAFGAEALAKAQPLVSAAEALEEELAETSRSDSGLIRLAAPMDFGRMHLAPLLPEFMVQYPDIRLELRLDDARIDLVAEGHDLALRIGALGDSSLVARRLCAVGTRLVAAPAYLEAYGEPLHPADLAQHRALLYSNIQPPDVWRFTGPNGAVWAQTVTSPLMANSGDALLPALRAGHGIALLPDFMLWEDMEWHRLLPLLAGWKSASHDLHLVTPPGRRRPARVRLLMDWLTRRMENAPWIRG